MRLRQNQKGYVYFIRQGEEDIFKIGMTYKTPEKRLEQIQINSVYPLTIYGAIYTENPRKLEAQLHDQFSLFRLRGEWFSLSGSEVKTILDNHSNTIQPNFIELSQKRKRFWYRIDTGQLFTDIHNLKSMSQFYIATVMAASNRLIFFKDGSTGVDYDLLIDDWPELRSDLKGHKELLLNAAKVSLENGADGIFQDGQYVEL